MNFPDRKYQIVYADPPWQFNFHKRKGLSDEAISCLYPTLDGDSIADLQIEPIVNKNALLFLWVMNSEIPLALKCIGKWGFDYITVAFTWVKTTKNTYHFGGGNWTRSNPELCLLAKRGKISRVSASIKNLVMSPLQKHSHKPDEIRDAIVKLCGDLPRIELFAREQVDGWDALGNEIDGMDIRDSLELLKGWFESCGL